MSMSNPQPCLTLEHYAQRRQALLDSMPVGSVALIASGEEQIRNRDVDYPFRADSDFLYLTGFEEPDAVLVLIRAEVLESTDMAKPNHQAWLFLRPKDPEQETWEGRRLGVDAAPEKLGLDQAWCLDEINEIAPLFLTNAKQVWFSFAQLDDWGSTLTEWLGQLKAQVRKGGAVPTHLSDLDQLLHEQRLVKSAAEIALLKKAAQLSVEGHLAAMRATRPGVYEYQVQSALEHAFRMQGSARVAFNSIVAGGENACILHYTENNAPLMEGDLVLIDAGAEWQGYAGDISHTYPISGRFNTEQRLLYELVLAAQQAAIAAIKPGHAYHAMHKASSQVLTEGLLRLGLLHGELNQLIKEEAVKRFFMHGTGHWLGLDVHDVGRYKIDGEWRNFEPGMVVTVEPGLYISPDSEGIDSKWWGIGIRIEDDVLVTQDGHEVLTEGLPRTPEEIEQWMQTEQQITA